MEEKVAQLFSETVLETAASMFDATSKNAKKLGDFENYVFEVYKHKMNSPIVLRLTHSSHRSLQDVQAELEWVEYLDKKGINIAGPILSKDDNLVESIEVENSFFYVSCFIKAPGAPVKMDMPEFSDPLFYRWGKTIGAMNDAAKSYKVKDEKIKRPQWYEEELFETEQYLPEDDGIIHQITKELITELHALPTDQDSFGLIHSDIHSGNFFYDGENIYVFDFDDSSYHWFVSDIAIPLYYSLWMKRSVLDDKEFQAFASQFFTSFWKGYITKNNLSLECLQRMPLFLRLRDITLYSVFHKKLIKDEREGKYKNLIQSIRERIINKQPIVDLDYKEIIMNI